MDLLSVLLIVLFFLLSYFNTIIKIIKYWAANDMYSYGFFVPIISSIIVLSKENQYKSIELSPSYIMGTVALFGGLMMLLMGKLSSTNIVEEFSIIITICGLTLLLLGCRMFRVFLFPIAYLLSMIPFWDYFTNKLHPYFQLYSATIGVKLLNIFGIPVLRDGFIIELPNIRLEVVEACSGINYLIAIFAIGIPLTYLFVKDWHKRISIVFMSIMIALLSNGLRVAMVSLFAYYGIRGSDGDIHGPYALFRSLLISGVGFIALFAMIFHFSEKDNNMRAVWKPLINNCPVETNSHRLKAASVILALLIFSVYIGYMRYHKITSVPLSSDLLNFPQRIGYWESLDPGSFRNDMERIEFDEKISKNYLSPDGTELNIFFGYYRKQEQEKELVGYHMHNYLNNKGKSIHKTKYGGNIIAKDFVTIIGEDNYHMTYWYILGDEAFSEDYTVKLFTALNSIIKGTTNGGIVVLKKKLRNQESLENSRAQLQVFICELMGDRIAKSHSMRNTFKYKVFPPLIP